MGIGAFLSTMVVGQAATNGKIILTGHGVMNCSLGIRF